MVRLAAGLAACLLALPVRAADSEIVLPINVSGAAGPVAVEVDGIDMTAFVTIRDGEIAISAAAALEPGRHEAVIYVETGGVYSEFARYSFDAGGSVGSSQLDWTFSATHEAEARSLNGDVATKAQSAGELTVETLDKSVSARVSYFGTNREDDQLTDLPFDIGEYSIEIRQSGALLDLVGRVGHQVVGYDTALIADLNRRGLSFDATLADERVQFSAFGLKSVEALGVENLLGLAEDEDRMFGGRLAFRPFQGADFRVSLQGYEGRGVPLYGLEVGTGAGTGLSLDGSFIDGRLRYNLAGAAVDWDVDSSGPLPEDQAEAIKAQVDFDFEPNAKGRSLSLGFGYDRVDLFYYSLANPGIEPGGETLRLTADYAADRLTLFGELGATKTNVGAPADYETDLITRIAVNGRYDLFDAGFLSDTTLSFDGSIEQLRRIATPMGAPAAADWDSMTATLGIEKTSDFGGWTANYTYNQINDLSASNDDLTSHELFASYDHQFDDRLTLGVTGLVGTYDSTIFGSHRRTDATLDLGYDIDPGRWNLALSLAVAETTELGVLDGHAASGVLTWTINPATELVFNAGRYHGAMASESGTDHDQIFGVLLRVRTDIPQ